LTPFSEIFKIQAGRDALGVFLMPKLRLSIGTILKWIALLGIGFAALKNSSQWWANGLLLGDVCLCVFALMSIGYRSGARRAFWIGFALFGWAYLILAFAPGVREMAKPHLVSTKLLQKMVPEVEMFAFVVSLNGTVTGSGSTSTVGPWTVNGVMQTNSPATITLRSTSGSTGPAWGGSGTTAPPYILTADAPIGPNGPVFHRVGHALCVVLAGIIGGGIALLLFATRRRSPSDEEAGT
jgi:hypothetical protein